jgi:ectoine hydroxylase-related dioxygenase (phytanoyl-CoA dioxygenase family)
VDRENLANRRRAVLTEQQKHEFETFGFLLLKDLIPPDEMRLYIDAFDETMTKANGGVRWQHAPKNHTVIPFYRHNPAVYHHLLDDEKLSAAVGDLLGEDFVFLAAEGHRRWGGSGWHHDSVAPDGLTHLKVVFYLQPVRADTGCLRVLPGTHFPPMRERMELWYERHGNTIVSEAKESDTIAWPAAIALESDPGDAVIFDVKVYHGAVGNSADRRAIYINYIEKPRTPDQEEYITSDYDAQPLYTPELFEDATPKRMRMLSFLKDARYDAR